MRQKRFPRSTRLVMVMVVVKVVVVGVVVGVVEAAQAVVAILRVASRRQVLGLAQVMDASRLVVENAKERPPAGGALRLLSNHL